MEINIERSPQHWCPSEGLNSELFAHENDTLTARPQDGFPPQITVYICVRDSTGDTTCGPCGSMGWCLLFVLTLYVWIFSHVLMFLILLV